MATCGVSVMTYRDANASRGHLQALAERDAGLSCSCPPRVARLALACGPRLWSSPATGSMSYTGVNAYCVLARRRSSLPRREPAGQCPAHCVPVWAKVTQTARISRPPAHTHTQHQHAPVNFVEFDGWTASPVAGGGMRGSRLGLSGAGRLLTTPAVAWLLKQACATPVTLCFMHGNTSCMATDGCIHGQ